MAFLDVAADRRKFRLTSELVEGLKSEAWHENPTAAVRSVMLQAIDKLSDDDTPRNAAISWRRAARILFGFDETLPGDGRTQPSYKLDYVPRLERESGYIGETFKRHVTRGVREELARVLLELEPGNSTPAGQQLEIPDAAMEQGSPQLLYRYGYVEAIRDYVRAGKHIVAIWGEGGMGKTVLAEQAAHLLANGGQVLTLRTSTKELLQDDVVSALIAEGLEPSSWSAEYCRVALRQRLSDSPRSAVVVVDNVSAEETLWQLVPSSPKIPVLVTTRLKLRDARVATIELREFTKQQAWEFVGSSLVGCDDEELRAFVHTIGHRPLALAHAVLFLREAGDVSLVELTHVLAQGITEGLSLVALPDQGTKSLVSLYREILAAISASKVATEVLDSFLAIAGRGAAAPYELVRQFLESERRCNRVRLRAGLRILADYGLLREDKRKHREGEWPWLTMHPLTYAITRELRGMSPLHTELDYWLFVCNYSCAPDEKGWLPTFQDALAAGADLHPGWHHILCIDENTWMALRQDSDEQDVYLVHYETFPNAVYRIDSRTGVREQVQLEEGRILYRLTKLYNRRLQED